jgi:formate dehydrogenase iron-sulfur subunit
MCYDRLKGGMEPACSSVCPTKSIQFGPLDDLREAARERVATLHERGTTEARLYLADGDDGVQGAGAFFLLLDRPEVYGLPPDPVATTFHTAGIWKAAGVAGAGLVALVGAAVGVGRRWLR